VRTRTGAQIVLDVIADEGVDVVFGYPGGAIMPLYDALYDHAVQHVLVRHEAAAAFAAGGYARSTGRVGVCVATSGPGATNLITGIADAMLDNIPLLALTGQVRTGVHGTDAFQEVDIAAATQAFTKNAVVVSRADDLESALRRAFELARSGRPGPVLVDLPNDVLKAKSTALADAVRSRRRALHCGDENVQSAFDAIMRSSRPLLIAGGGVRWNATPAFRRFCALTGIPHCSTLHGIGAAHPADTRYFGMAGMHGTKRANLAIDWADCIVAFGMRFDDRITGDPRLFAPNARTIAHADIDASEFGKTVRCDIPLHGDVLHTLETLNRLASATPLPSFETWTARIRCENEMLPLDPAQPGQLSATDTLDALFDALPADAIVTTDVGQHQMWASQRIRPCDGKSFLSSGGLGSMGFGLPAAIGAQIAHPDRPVFCVIGDGGFQMCMAELATLRRYELPVKIVLIDNAHLGMVRQWQQLFFDDRRSETHLPENPDFTIIASAYGISAQRVSDSGDLHSTIGRFVRTRGAALLHCSCHPFENVWPLIPSGTSVAQMMDALPA
jgi:acetolactate synthase I/II/III large subunit